MSGTQLTLKRTFSEYSGNNQGTRTPAGNIQGTFREHSGNIPTTNMQGAFRES
jgi:hypothetical protein